MDICGNCCYLWYTEIGTIGGRNVRRAINKGSRLLYYEKASWIAIGVTVILASIFASVILLGLKLGKILDRGFEEEEHEQS